MNRKTRFNPAFAGPTQQLLRLGAAPGGYWSGVKDDHWPEDIRYFLDPLTARFTWQADASWLAIPIAMGRDPLRKDGDPWCITKLALMDPEAVYPTRRNGVLHRWAAEHLTSLLDIARERGISPHALPMNVEEAYEMDLEIEDVAWPWLRDRALLDQLEKSIRMHVYRAMPDMRKGREIEVDFLHANTTCFLETGFHAVTTPDDVRIEHRLDLQEDAVVASAPFFDFWWDDLRDSLVLPMWSRWEEKEEAYLVQCSRGGFFEDAPGWRREETAALHAAIEGQRFADLYGRDLRDPPTDPKIVAAMDRLLGFAREAEKRQNHDLVYA